MMNKVGGHRNFGYGKKMAWAGKQAIRDRYGEGHYATVASHTERWKVFVQWCQAVPEIRDAQNINREVLDAYGEKLASDVDAGRKSVAYAQNLLSTVNVVLQSMRGDRCIRIAPADAVGRRNNIRTEPPAGLDRDTVRQCVAHLQSIGHERIASVVELTRELGLRLREASLLDTKAALRQARRQGKVNITAGTKGGRGRHVDRWVPVTKSAMRCLGQAAAVQGNGRNLIPPQMSWKQWNHHLHNVWKVAREPYGLKKIHDLRTAYACDRYQQITGSAAPVVTGRRQASRWLDKNARNVIAQELGHARSEVVATYVGSAK